MSLSSVGAVNVITGLVAKKSAEVAAASGALLASVGILIGAHGIGLWNSAHSADNSANRDRQTLQSKSESLQNMELRIKNLSKTLNVSCASSTNAVPEKNMACVGGEKPAYTSLIQNVRALQMDLPQWAAQNGITITNMMDTSGPAIAMPGASNEDGSPVPGYNGINQKVIKVSGNYSTLQGLRQFVKSFPNGIELTGIKIHQNLFTAEITAYGITA